MAETTLVTERESNGTYRVGYARIEPLTDVQLLLEAAKLVGLPGRDLPEYTRGLVAELAARFNAMRKDLAEIVAELAERRDVGDRLSNIAFSLGRGVVLPERKRNDLDAVLVEWNSIRSSNTPLQRAPSTGGNP